jgi:hypothetical protein
VQLLDVAGSQTFPSPSPEEHEKYFKIFKPFMLLPSSILYLGIFFPSKLGPPKNVCLKFSTV